MSKASEWRMSQPCENCPFAASGAGLQLRRSLAPGRWREILAGLRRGETFNCHKTTEHDDDGEWIVGTGLYCAGALEWQEAHDCTSNYARVADRLHAFTRPEGAS